MIVARFGGSPSSWAAAYQFPTTLMEDSWEIVRRPPIQQVGGAGGVFDYFSTTVAPPQYIVVHKKFALTAASSSAIDDARDTLVAATIKLGNDNLWWMDRDTSTTYWAHAKCTSFDCSESYQEKGRWLKKVELEFMCNEGLWYGGNIKTYTDTGISGSPSAHTVGTNAGNYPAMVIAGVTARGSTATGTTKINCQLASPGTISCDLTATIAQDSGFGVNSFTYSATNGAADAYANFAMSGPTRLCWLWLDPGSNIMNFTISSTTYDVGVSWYDTYVAI